MRTLCIILAFIIGLAVAFEVFHSRNSSHQFSRATTISSADNVFYICLSNWSVGGSDPQGVTYFANGELVGTGTEGLTAAIEALKAARCHRVLFIFPVNERQLNDNGPLWKYPYTDFRDQNGNNLATLAQKLDFVIE